MTSETPPTWAMDEATMLIFDWNTQRTTGVNDSFANYLACALAKVRTDALEEAVKLIETIEVDYRSVGDEAAYGAAYCARAIRKLKEPT